MAGPNVHELVTAKILEALETGSVPWRKPWTGGGALPRSLATGKAHRGINPFLLQMEATANKEFSNLADCVAAADNDQTEIDACEEELDRRFNP